MIGRFYRTIISRKENRANNEKRRLLFLGEHTFSFAHMPKTVSELPGCRDVWHVFKVQIFLCSVDVPLPTNVAYRFNTEFLKTLSSDASNALAS